MHVVVFVTMTRKKSSTFGMGNQDRWMNKKKNGIEAKKNYFHFSFSSVFLNIWMETVLT